MGGWAGLYEHDPEPEPEFDASGLDVEEWVAAVAGIVKDGYHPMSQLSSHQSKVIDFRQTAKFLLDSYATDTLDAYGFCEKFMAYWRTHGYNPADKPTLSQVGSLAATAVSWEPSEAAPRQSSGGGGVAAAKSEKTAFVEKVLSVIAAYAGERDGYKAAVATLGQETMDIIRDEVAYWASLGRMDQNDVRIALYQTWNKGAFNNVSK